MKKRDSITIKRGGRTVEIEVEYKRIPKKEREAYKQRMRERLERVHKLKLVFG